RQPVLQRRSQQRVRPQRGRDGPEIDAEVIAAREQQGHDDGVGCLGQRFRHRRPGVIEVGRAHGQAGLPGANRVQQGLDRLLRPGIAGTVRDREQAHRQASCSRSRTTSPITTTAGAAMPCRTASAATVDSVATTTRSSASVPLLITAAGVAPARPRLMSSAAIAAKFPTAINSTSVPALVPSPSQSTVAPGCDGSMCAETTAKSWVRPRWVTGIPAYAGTATALV